MQIKIGDRYYNLTFGFDALDYLDSVYRQSAEGLTFGFGLNEFLTQISLRNITVIRHAIKAGTSTEKSRPSNADIERFAAEMLTAEEEGESYEELLAALKKQPLTAQIAKRVLTAQEEAVRAEQAQTEPGNPSI